MAYAKPSDRLSQNPKPAEIVTHDEADVCRPLLIGNRVLDDTLYEAITGIIWGRWREKSSESKPPLPTARINVQGTLDLT